MELPARPAAHPASFRDPSGFVFRQNGLYYRFVAPGYQPHYERLMGSGLYQRLTEEGLMIQHTEVPDTSPFPEAYKILLPQQLETWSYPYEWSFSQLQDAALATLQLTRLGLKEGLILKDASAYNLQFHEGRPLLIDSLSFELYEEGQPWAAFRQFCSHFLYPLLLQSRLRDWQPSLLMAFPEGLTAPFTASLMPRGSRLSLNNQLYLYLPASMTGKSSSREAGLRLSKNKILQNLDQLSSFIGKLRCAQLKSNWKDYYQETILSAAYLQHKTETVRQWMQELNPARITDIGCNTGAFSLLAPKGARVMALDTDPLSIDAFYREVRKLQRTNITPIVGDITNPAPAMGWDNAERAPLLARIGCDLCLALALIHHLALSKNIPLPAILRTLAGITAEWLILEFVPKEDPKARLLLQHRPDIFPHYTQEHFEAAAAVHFTLIKAAPMEDSGRILYLFRRHIGASQAGT